MARHRERAGAPGQLHRNLSRVTHIADDVAGTGKIPDTVGMAGGSDRCGVVYCAVLSGACQLQNSLRHRMRGGWSLISRASKIGLCLNLKVRVVKCALAAVRCVMYLLRFKDLPKSEPFRNLEI